jgi:hypothetical protein
MLDSLKRVKQFRDKEVAMQKILEVDAPKVGDLGPDFDLPAARGHGNSSHGNSNAPSSNTWLPIEIRVKSA